MRMTSQRVAPSACAASMWKRGAWENTSRVTAVMIGRIITASTTPPVKIVPVRTGRLPGANRKNQPRLVRSQRRDRQQGRREDRDAPEAVDDRRHGGQQVDHVGERARDPLGRVLGEEQRDAQGDRHREDQGEQRRQQRDHEQVADAEVEVRRVAGVEHRRRQEVGVVRQQGGHRLHEQEEPDRGDGRDDEEAGARGQPAEDAFAASPGGRSPTRPSPTGVGVGHGVQGGRPGRGTLVLRVPRRGLPRGAFGHSRGSVRLVVAGQSCRRSVTGWR